MQAAASGELPAFGELYNRYLDPIYRYIYYRVSDLSDAEDLTEDVFVRAWVALQKVTPDSGIRNFRAWLYRIAHNHVVDFHRRAAADKVVEMVDAESVISGESSVEGKTIQNLEAGKLESALRRLDEKLQEIVILRFINGLSHAETAAIVGLKEGHVRVLQYRALKKLRDILEKDW